MEIMERSLKIDVLRGIAVIGMMIAHGLFFFHNSSNRLLMSLEGILNATVLTVFVFVFGQSLSRWLDAHIHDDMKRVWLYSLKRAGLVYLLYIFIGSVAIATSTASLSGFVGMLIFSNPPNFTEYMPLFIILILLTPFLKSVFTSTRISTLTATVVASISYVLGFALYQTPVPLSVSPLKALLAGDGMSLRFPVLFYLPVVLFGLRWQHAADHEERRICAKSHFRMLFLWVLLTVFGFIATRTASIPVLNPGTRWPPSVTFLALGTSLAALALFLAPSFSRIGPRIKQVVEYFGRDAIDIWTNHLLILFLYRKFIQIQSESVFFSFLMVILLIVASVLLSSVTVINRIVFPIPAFSHKPRFRKKYFAYGGLVILVFLWLTTLAPPNPYGDFMNPPAPARSTFPKVPLITLSSRRIWHLKHVPTSRDIDLTLTITSADDVPINPNDIRFTMNNQIFKFSETQSQDGSWLFTRPISDLVPGAYVIRAFIDDGTNAALSNEITVIVSEPLLVAWTFDWEGWDAPDDALDMISELTDRYPSVRFSHFVNPRMFLPDVVPQSRGRQLASFLTDRHEKGDEVGLHLHMQFDLVREAGILPKRTHPWGLLTKEGYDVPTTEYTPAEFRQIVLFAKKLAAESGLPEMTGYRAGGWFINAQQLRELAALGFAYDSSGRDKPTTGAFRQTPWNLPVGAQPYYPDSTDQNLAASQGSILEIPTNGLTTYDQTTDMLVKRAVAVYQGGILTEPKALVYVSHPQFYGREFPKIPEVLAYFSTISHNEDRGPAVFMTTGDIYALWNTLKK